MSGDVPAGLAQRPTGAELAALLARVEVSAVADEQLLELLLAETRQLAHQQARVWAVLSELANRAPGNLPAALDWTPNQVFDSAVDEVRAELRWTRRSARRELEQADLVCAQPRIAAALRTGQIDRRRAIVLAEGCLGLTTRQVGVLLDEVLPGAGQVTATGLAERIRRVAIALDPQWAERRYREAVQRRRVIGYLAEDGTAVISGQGLPADEAAAACARVDALADAAKRAGAAAPLDHLRAEIFLGLLGGRFADHTAADIVAALTSQYPKPAERPAPAGPIEPSTRAGDEPGEEQSGVELRVGLATLLELDEHPGEIAGWGPVPASVARHLAVRQRRGQWRYAVVDDTGRLLADGLTRRRPPITPETNGGGEPPGPLGGGIVELQVPARLLADPDFAAEHPGWGPLIRDLADRYWGQRPLVQDPRARVPGRPLRRRSEIKHRSCLFPGCRRPASDCQQDHRRDYARGGPTSEGNIGPGCGHDHDLKTRRGWRLVKRDDTTYVWISPLGRRHVVTIDPVAPPLPAPIPRASNPARHADWPDTEEPLRATLWTRPASAAAGAEPTAAPSGTPRPPSDPDPPPY